jgi:predicted nuclease of predicted toxin-antitoxin system
MTAFYLDEDTPESLAQTLAGYGHIVTTTRQADRKGAKDYEQLWFAATQDSVLLTLNRKDFTLLHGAWQHWGVDRPHAGIIILHTMDATDLLPIAEDINTLVGNPQGYFAVQVLADETSWNVDTVTNHLFRRRKNGMWDVLG